MCLDIDRKKADDLLEVGRTKTHVDRDRAFRIMARGGYQLHSLRSKETGETSDDPFEVEACGYPCERGGVQKRTSIATALSNICERTSPPLRSLFPKVDMQNLTIRSKWKRAAMLASAGRARTHVGRGRASRIMARGQFPSAKLVSKSRLQNSDDLFEVEACATALSNICERASPPLRSFFPNVDMQNLTIRSKWKRAAMLASAGRARTHVGRGRASRIMARGQFPNAKLGSRSRLQKIDDLFEVEACATALSNICERASPRCEASFQK